MPIDERRPRRWLELITRSFSFLRWLASTEQLPEPSESAEPVPRLSPSFLRWLWSSDELLHLEAQRRDQDLNALSVLMSRDTLPEHHQVDSVMAQESPLRHFLRWESLPEPPADDPEITRGGLLRHFFRRETLDNPKSPTPK